MRLRRRVFISYRHDDTGHTGARIADELKKAFGRERVFIDTAEIEPGQDFFKTIEDAIQTASVIVVLIGPNWLSVSDANGNRRLDKSDDFVAMEVAAGLERDAEVIPVLVDGAKIPTESELPPRLRKLSHFEAVTVDYSSFDSDTRGLIREVNVSLVRSANRSWVRGGPAQEESIWSYLKYLFLAARLHFWVPAVAAATAIIVIPGIELRATPTPLPEETLILVCLFFGAANRALRFSIRLFGLKYLYWGPLVVGTTCNTALFLALASLPNEWNVPFEVASVGAAASGALIVSLCIAILNVGLTLYFIRISDRTVNKKGEVFTNW